MNKIKIIDMYDSTATPNSNIYTTNGLLYWKGRSWVYEFVIKQSYEFWSMVTHKKGTN